MNATTCPDRADTLLCLGRVYRAHGLSGEVKVIPETADSTKLESASALYMGQTPDTARRVNVQGVRRQYARKGLLVLLKLENVDSREAAEALRGALLYAQAEAAGDLARNEFSWRDLTGFAVIEENGDRVGTVEDVLAFPGQEMLVIARNERPSAMVPAVPEFVAAVDPEAKRMTLRTIEGLLDA